jgi:two-component system response regulator YesN
MLLGRNQVINYQDITPKTIRELPVQIREIHSEIISMAGTGEISWAVARIHLLFDQLKQFGVLDLHYIVAVCTDIYTSMVERTAGLSHADRESEIYRFIQEIGTLTFIQDMEQLMVKEILRFDQLMRNMRHVDTPRAVRSAKEFIAHWYMDHLTLKDIADKVYLTPTYLAALFKKETGLTINEYLTQIRIERAKELLRDIGLSIQDVSEAVGYQDSRYFSRLFKNMTGGTPAWYRRHGT